MGRVFVILIITIFILSCSSKNESSESVISDNDWIVDETDVTGIFSLYPLSINPDFDAIKNINLDDEELVGVIYLGSDVIVYPYVFTFENEVINDEHNGQKFAFTYCPITKSAISFTRTEIFRASGYLYKNNLTPWDDQTESIWSQMLMKGIRGDKKNSRFNTIPVLETTWGTAKEYFPRARVLAGVPSLNNKMFSKTPPEEEPNSDSNENKPNLGEYVYGIIDNFDNVHIFKYSDFSNKILLKIINNQNYIIVGNQFKRFINAFKVGDFDEYEILENQLPFIIKNKRGVKYDFLGVGTDGSILEKPKYAYVAIWRAWEDFYLSFDYVEK
jgi:hypothetical protein